MHAGAKERLGLGKQGFVHQYGPEQMFYYLYI
jgi:hypothetical protein